MTPRQFSIIPIITAAKPTINVYTTNIIILSVLRSHLNSLIDKNPTTAETIIPTTMGVISTERVDPSLTASLSSSAAAATIAGIPRIKE